MTADVAEEKLKYAEKFYNFSIKNPGYYHETLQSVYGIKITYPSMSHWDEPVWAAAWLAKAFKEIGSTASWRLLGKVDRFIPSESLTTNFRQQYLLTKMLICHSGIFVRHFNIC